MTTVDLRAAIPREMRLGLPVMMPVNERRGKCDLLSAEKIHG